MSPQKGTYWRSLAQLSDDPEARAFLEREFPENASELPEGVTRRTMLTLLGASLSLAGLAGCRRPVENIVPYVTAPEEIIPGIPLRYATTMPLGTSAFGLVVESHEGRPTKIEGNELHPSSAGATNAAIQASILDLYDPDRSPFVRQTAPDSGESRKSWSDFEALWSGLQETYLANGGAGLAVLAESYSSPTFHRLVGLFRERFPLARFVVHDPVSDEKIHAGVEQVTGQKLRPVYDFARAQVILSLESDFMLTESENVRHAAGFADGRRIRSTSDSMNRLYVVESGLSLTGANADHRLRLRSGKIVAFVANLAHQLNGRGLALTGTAGAGWNEDHEAWIQAVADDLVSAGSRSLIVAGRRQPAELHAAVFALNAALGNVGTTLSFHPMPDTATSSTADLLGLAAAMRKGAVEGLILLGGNPVYSAPFDLEFADALSRVAQVIHLGSHRDETAELAAWHLPRTHFLESWGDARAADGTPSLIQPLIAPLFDGRSEIELLGLLVTGQHVPGFDLVRESWRSLLPEVDFDRRWNRVLHDGLLTDGALSPTTPIFRDDVFLRLRPLATAALPGGLEIVFRPSPAVFDGRLANNGWMQELPDPVTKLTWDNAALVSPGTAKRLGVGNSDLVTLSYGGRELTLPIWIVPGQVDDSVHLDLGYGRRAALRIGNGKGFDAYSLRTSKALDFDGGLDVRPAGGRYPLATSQDHFTLDELGIKVRAERVPTLIREATLEEYRHEPGFAAEMVKHPPLTSLWQERSYDEGLQWGMSIDLTVCNGCNACVTACQSENNIPVVGKEQVAKGREMHWLRIDRYWNGDIADPQTVFQPVPCMQCENAPCEQVCPVAATVHDSEGLNTMAYNRCIGTRYCQNNCPYKVRRFNFFNFTKDTPELQKMAANPDVTVRSRGVMEKCTYCTQRINAAKIDAKLAGRELADGEVTTACEQACPTKAITFGNIRDPQSRVSAAKAQPRNYVMIAELNNKPRTSFLAKLRNPNPALVEG